jgi:hypothetical protein
MVCGPCALYTCWSRFPEQSYLDMECANATKRAELSADQVDAIGGSENETDDDADVGEFLWDGVSMKASAEVVASASIVVADMNN